MVTLAPTKQSTLPPSRWWRCEACGRTLGQVIGLRLIVVVRGEELRFPVVAGTEFPCPKCGKANVLESST